MIRKGTRALQQLPASPDAFVWLRLYQAQMQGLVPAGRDQPLWWTLRRPFRPLTYHAARRMFDRANAALGANWSLHDLRHTAAYRMARDPEMPLTDVQWVLGHAHLSTTQMYLTPLPERRDRRACWPTTPGSGRSAAPAPPAGAAATGPRALQVLFGEDARDRRLAHAGRAGGGRSPAAPRLAAPAGATGAELLRAVPAAAGGRRRGRRPGQPRPRCWPGCWRRRSRWTTRPARQSRRLGLASVLDWLESQPGDTWQERWAGQRRRGRPARLAGRWPPAGCTAAPGCRGAAADTAPGRRRAAGADLRRRDPARAWRGCSAPARPRNLAAEMARTRDPAGFAALAAAVPRPGRSGPDDAGCALAPDRDHHGRQGRHRQRHHRRGLPGAAARSRRGHASGRPHASSPYFYQLLHALGRFPADAPADDAGVRRPAGS